MERVGILVNKLQEQFQQRSDAHKMLVTVQMLYTELMQEREKLNGAASHTVLVSAPGNPPPITPVNIEAVAEPEQPLVPRGEEKPFIEEIPVVESKPAIEEKPIVVEEPVVVEEVNEVAEVASPAPLVVEERKVDLPFDFVYNHNPKVEQPTRWGFDPVEIPTLAHQEKVVYHLAEQADDNSLNDKLKEEKVELSNVLQDAPIKDLKKAISINDRHRFIEALFRGDETMYERSIKTINNFSIYAEAEFWIQRELKLKIGWNNNSPEVKLFDQLVKRRFL